LTSAHLSPSPQSGEGLSLWNQKKSLIIPLFLIKGFYRQPNNVSNMFYFIKTRIRLAINIVNVLACLCCTTNAMCQQKVIQLYNGPVKGSENWNWEEKLFFVKTPLNAMLHTM